MSDWLSERVAQIMADEYVKGASVQQISTQSGYSITRVRSLLDKSGVVLRGRGRPKKAVQDVV